MPKRWFYPVNLVDPVQFFSHLTTLSPIIKIKIENEKMSGETNLNKLLAQMAPQLLPDEYIFCSIPDGKYGDYAELAPFATVRETEGLTIVITRESADTAGIKYQSTFRGITLMVHSSLEAVGLTAAVSAKLSEHHISANVIAGYYHDHIFVQAERANAAIEALNELRNSNTVTKILDEKTLRATLHQIVKIGNECNEFEAIELLFGWAWGAEAPTWTKANISWKEISAAIADAEAKDERHLGKDDIILYIGEDEIKFCHESDIHYPKFPQTRTGQSICDLLKTLPHYSNDG